MGNFLSAHSSGWSPWGPCSVSCGNGVRRRTRHCQKGNCPGQHFESAICNDGPCAVQDASWGGIAKQGGMLMAIQNIQAGAIGQRARRVAALGGDGECANATAVGNALAANSNVKVAKSGQAVDSTKNLSIAQHCLGCPLPACSFRVHSFPSHPALPF